MTYYISPRFLNKLAVHITKNFLDLPGVRVPLILGIHGRKGEGKTFQCDLVFERMGIEVVRMSAGELESPDAGDPSRLVRLRYRETAELVKVRGKMAVLLINDLDAGAGRFDQGTQYTVNTQMVNGTLMNIADHPTNVQLPGSYDEKPIRRVPIIATGNDFSTLYAPLIRDGRMEKFFWAPDRSDRIGIVGGIFAPDGLRTQEIEALVDTFPGQSIDFFSALRARVYDEQVQRFIQEIGIEQVSMRVVNSESGPPNFPKPQFSLVHLQELGTFMVNEQKRIEEMRLVREYNQNLNRGKGIQPGSETLMEGGDRTSLDHQTHQSIHLEHNGQEQAGATPILSKMAMADSKTIALHEMPEVARGVNPDLVNQVLHLLDEGYRVGLEHVDKRRFQANSWQSCEFIEAEATQSGQGHSVNVDQDIVDQDIIDQLDACLRQHKGEYVRLVGIDPKAKRRVVETIIQRP